MSVAPPPGPPNVRRMLDAVRGENAAAAPPSVSAMLDAVRGGERHDSPPSVAAMVAEVRGGGAVSPPSTAAMLAAVRGVPVRAKRKATAPAAAAKGPAKKRSVADILAAARAADGGGAESKTAATPAKPAGGRPSVADILAKARGKAVANPKSGEQSSRLDRKADAPAPIPLSVAEMVRELRARERAVTVSTKPRRSVGGWFVRVFGSRA